MRFFSKVGLVLFENIETRFKKNYKNSNGYKNQILISF